MTVAKKTFQPENSNTYRGYFPAQPRSDNLKEEFEIGPTTSLPQNIELHPRIRPRRSKRMAPRLQCQGKT